MLASTAEACGTAGRCGGARPRCTMASVSSVGEQQPATTSPRGRRVLPPALAGTGMLLLIVAVVARWNPWRLLTLMPLAGARPLVAFVAGALALGGAAVPAWLPRRFKAAATTSLYAVVAALLVCGLPALTLKADLLGRLDYHTDRAPTAVAVSPDGRFSVVEKTYTSNGDSDAYYRTLTIRTQAGLLSRESAHVLALLWHDNTAESNVEITSTRFTGRHEVAMDTSDGRHWTTIFDPHTLATPRQLATCQDAQVCWQPA
jgi:hypothetical protein